MDQIDILLLFRRISPDRLISQYQDWILLFLLIFFFWSVVTIALKKRFGDSKAFRVLATTTALMLSVGMYYLIHLNKLYFSLEGLGLFGALLIFIVLFFIMYGLNKSLKMNSKITFPLTFILFYISLYALSPNIMNNLQDIFPLSKFFMLLIFLACLILLSKEVWKEIKGKFKPDLKEAAKEVSSTPVTTQDEPEINHEIKDDKKENKLLKGKTLKLTKYEIHTIDDMENSLEHLVKTIKSHGTNITQEETLEISKLLKTIAEKENILISAMPKLKRQAEIYKSKHRKDIHELQKRYSEAKNNPKQQKAIQEELHYQKQMIQLLDFIETYEKRIIEFTQNLNQTISKAMQKLRSLYPHDCIEYLEYAKKEIAGMRHIFKKQKELEKYILKLNKKTIKDLKKEKTSNQD